MTEPAMYVPRMDAFLNHWYKTYDEAKTDLDRDGGFLFPYGSQFFVTTASAIRELGLDPDDPDWEEIGWDWVQPKNPGAKERLVEKRLIQS